MSNPKSQPEVLVECRTCGEVYPKTDKYFKIYSVKGRKGFRKRCRACHDAQVEKWQTEHPEDMRNNVRRYQTRKPEVREVYARNRRARERQVESSPFTAEEVLAIYGAVCYLCDTPIDLTLPRSVGTEGWEGGLHLDHLIPLGEGGPNTLRNVRPTHAICNLRRPKKLSKKP